MEIHLAPATEAQLRHLATSQGKNAAQVVEETVTRNARTSNDDLPMMIYQYCPMKR